MSSRETRAHGSAPSKNVGVLADPALATPLRRSLEPMLGIPSLPEFASELMGRVDGPFAFRFVLQPIMAAIYAIRDGVADARDARPAYLWSILTEPAGRRALLREGWHHVVRVLVLGVVMDVLYQVIVLKAIRPLQLVVI